ncbi:MAG: response regulator transcription factor [Candidatus Dormibacteraeota bacterium]|nr:response regulator transcription factor [Candidatus Dormibacteraeota bacterium]MBO0762059.1 response regulator transcription factor [Candidatus Dormibacteraeota bacterium]
MTIRVLIADDQALVRAGLRMVVEARDDLEVVGEAADGAEAAALAAQACPDVVLMDVRMPVLDGIEATRRILGGGPGPGAHVLMLTTFDLDEYVYEALRAGAAGFLLKDAPPAELAHAIRTVAAGEALLAPSVTRRLIERYLKLPAPRPARPDVLDGLSAREREVLRLVARGLSNQEIAGQLHLSLATVKSHVARLLTKLDLHDRTQAVVLAYETGFVTPGG